MTRSLASDVLALSMEHVGLVLIAVAVAVALAVPGGIVLTRSARLRRWLLGFANVVQTIPSLAVFGILLPVPLIGGVGKRTAIVALVLYALLPVLRNTLVGILGIDPAVRESAVAMGMTDWQLLLQVEMPLAVPMILAGIRIATVTTIGTATIAAVIGGGGLGGFHFSWNRDGGHDADTCGRNPGGCDGAPGGRGFGMGRAQIVACLMLLTALGCSRPPSVVVGSKNFTEQIILGEILAQQLERRTQLVVQRKFNLGGTLLTHEALASGALDLYPEYTGTALTAILKEKPSSDRDVVFRRVKSVYHDRWRLEWLPPLGFANTFAMTVRGERGRAERLNTLSDAARSRRSWKLGAGYEFLQRPDGLPGLLQAYGLRIQDSPVSMDLGLLYQALDHNQVDMIAANATDGLLSVLDVRGAHR